MTDASEDEVLLRVEGLKTHFFSEEGVAKAVDGIDFEVRRGETLGIVGESGCGKSVTALSILDLVPDPPGRIVEGRILYRGRDLLQLRPRELQAVRGNEIAMIFQEPMTALNPVFTVGDQIAEAAKLHLGLKGRAARAHAVEMLRRVGIPGPEQRVHEYPHQLSGGMRQRVMIAIAMACDPAVLVADEPTTALDVTVQAQILDLIARLQEESGTSVLLITHDLGVIAEAADRVIVMYAGKIVERARVEDLFERPRHPYTAALFRSLPELSVPGERLAAIEGTVPSAWNLPGGCRFRTRCALARAECAEYEPPLVRLDEPGSDHEVACPFHAEVTR